MFGHGEDWVSEAGNVLKHAKCGRDCQRRKRGAALERSDTGQTVDVGEDECGRVGQTQLVSHRTAERSLVCVLADGSTATPSIEGLISICVNLYHRRRARALSSHSV